ncbi:MAG: LPS-assembly protein LptD [Gammaproteobacteria bacterium]|nr:LPS-assembly protein LptD [Gammaproteobacteria bacterium]
MLQSSFAQNSCISEAYRAKLIADHQNYQQFLQQIGWQPNIGTCCGGRFLADKLNICVAPGQIKLQAKALELNEQGCSSLSGNIKIEYQQQMLKAKKAYLLRNAKTGKIEEILLLDQVEILEPGKKIIANYAQYHPQTQAGTAWNAGYKVMLKRARAFLPAWGQAKQVERSTDGLINLSDASFSTCSPDETSWRIVAKNLELNPKTERGIARHTRFEWHKKPIFYIPYLSFPISGKRQSGFLTPTVGFSNISGYDFSLPYYWNIAPNLDATIVPHVYTMRGLMMGGEFRYLDRFSNGLLIGNFLPNDQLFAKFLESNSASYPSLNTLSKNRWSGIWRNQSYFTDHLGMKVDYEKVSDDYYLQDFSSNLSVMTENQLLRQGELFYQNDHWFMRGMLQNYQTLQPINQSFVTHLYARQPQLLANGHYQKVLGFGDLQLLGQFDQFQWTGGAIAPQGPRLHVNPNLSIPYKNAWGYVKPQLEFLGNFYQLAHEMNHNEMNTYGFTLPRYSVDGGLNFERFGRYWQQTLEPHVYYLYVPYQNQTVVPAFESAYMIFNTDQLFRPNRFSGYDRIGDTHQVSYALSSRLISPYTGMEKLSLTVGQIAYFKNRQLNLCYGPDGNCEDPSIYLGYLNPKDNVSPIASRGVYSLTKNWSIVGNYAYDANLNSSNNGDLNLHYQPSPERIIHLGYSYLVNGNVITGLNAPISEQSLNQLSAAYAWPFTAKWSSLAIYSYNISNGYAMLTYGGVQYDTCCYAFRLIGGRAFQSLEPQRLAPQYNNNIYVQILLKGIGAAANGDPVSTIQSYLPGLYNIFKN